MELDEERKLVQKDVTKTYDIMAVQLQQEQELAVLRRQENSMQKGMKFGFNENSFNGNRNFVSRNFGFNSQQDYCYNNYSNQFQRGQFNNKNGQKYNRGSNAYGNRPFLNQAPSRAISNQNELMNKEKFLMKEGVLFFGSDQYFFQHCPTQRLDTLMANGDFECF